jgi:hypothetical protein
MTISRTKDERFIICCYEEASKRSDVFTSLNRYEVGNLIGLHPKAVDTICALLVQANFIKKTGKTEICLTRNGEELVLRLLSE